MPCPRQRLGCTRLDSGGRYKIRSVGKAGAPKELEQRSDSTKKEDY